MGQHKDKGMETTWEELNKQQNQQQNEDEVSSAELNSSSSLHTSETRTDQSKARINWRSLRGKLINVVAAIGLVIGFLLIVDLFFFYGENFISLLLFFSESSGSGRLEY